MTTLAIEKGVTVTTGNPSWDRTFKVVEKKEKGGFCFWRCKWTQPDPDRNGSPEFNFTGFGVVKHKKSGIIKSWVISTWKGTPQDDRGIVGRGIMEMRQHRCMECREYVNFKRTSRKLGPEVVLVKYKCPKCGHVEDDVMD